MTRYFPEDIQMANKRCSISLSSRESKLKPRDTITHQSKWIKKTVTTSHGGEDAEKKKKKK